MLPSVANLSERKNREGVFGPQTLEVTTGSVLAKSVTICVLLKALLGQLKCKYQSLYGACEVKHSYEISFGRTSKTTLKFREVKWNTI